MTANLDSSIAFKSSGAIDVPHLSFSSSLKVDMPFCFKAAYKWSINLLQVSSHLKLRNTSYFPPLEEEEQEQEDDGRRAIKEMEELDWWG